MMKGYFAVGVERISKPGNVGNLMRTTHAFGGQFFFAVDPALSLAGTRESDTSLTALSLPVYEHDTIDEVRLPAGCQLVGVELVERAIPLPSFRHPRRAAYLLGPERGELSPEALARCDHVVQIPMQFCINVGMAGAIVLYDRMISLGRFAERPVRAGGPTETVAEPVFGGPRLRRAERSGDAERRARRPRPNHAKDG